MIEDLLDITLAEAYRPDTGSSLSFKKRNRQEFWSNAKSKILAVQEFHWAYDSDIDNMLLVDIFDDTGILKGKWTYGKIKEALAKDQNSWPLKSLMQFWVLQFKDAAPLLSQVKADEKKVRDEEAARKKAEQDKKDKEENDILIAKEEKLKEYKPLLEKAIQETIKKLADDGLIDEYNKKEQELKEKVFDAKNLESLLKGYNLEAQPPRPNLININAIATDVKLTSCSTSRYAFSGKTEAYFTIKVTYCSEGRYLSYDESFDVRLDDIDGKQEEEIIKLVMDNFIEKFNKKLTDMQAKIDECIKEIDSIGDRIKERKEKKAADLASKRKIGKEIQAAIDANKNPDAADIAMITNLFINGKKGADKEYQSWLGPHDDGDSGAAYAMAIYHVVENALGYMMDWNWDAIINNNVVSSYRIGDSKRVLNSAVMEIADNANDTLKFRFIKN